VEADVLAIADGEGQRARRITRTERDLALGLELGQGVVGLRERAARGQRSQRQGDEVFPPASE